MPRCAHDTCGRWRPSLLIRLLGLGLRLDDAWYCSSDCLQAGARQRFERAKTVVPSTLSDAPRLRLGYLLAAARRLSPDVLTRAARAQAQTGLRIGTQLVRQGAVSSADVLRALAVQSGVGYLAAVDSARLMLAPGNLSSDAVHRLRLVPFDADAGHTLLRVACTAPVPRTAIAVLRHLTGWIVEPYLVADEHWPLLAKAYGAARRSAQPVCATVSDFDAAAAYVARTARAAGRIHMLEVRGDDYIWVRMQASDRIEELWLASPDGPVGVEGFERDLRQASEEAAAGPGFDAPDDAAAHEGRRPAGRARVPKARRTAFPAERQPARSVRQAEHLTLVGSQEDGRRVRTWEQPSTATGR
jgi:hypothetical protein